MLLGIHGTRFVSRGRVQHVDDRLATPSLARAQACCAGGSAITPGRLEAHETALVGVELRAASVLGSYDSGGHYAGSPSGDTEFDLEQDIFGAVRVLRRGQVALLAVDATGSGAWQANLALALEQTYGSWFVNATAIVSRIGSNQPASSGLTLTVIRSWS